MEVNLRVVIADDDPAVRYAGARHLRNFRELLKDRRTTGPESIPVISTFFRTPLLKIEGL